MRRMFIFVLAWSLVLLKEISCQNTSESTMSQMASRDNYYSAIDSRESDEIRLLKDLLVHYKTVGRNARPVRNVSTPVPVKFGLGLIQMDLNEKDNVLTMSMWTRYQWKDEYLVWDPGQYGGVTSLRMRSDQIWIPDVMLYNTADVDRASRDTLAVVRPDGTVSWYPHCIFRSACSVDVTDYPFDIQNCHMWFGSWTYTSRELDLNTSFPGGIDLSTFQADYKATSKWEVLNVTALRLLMPPDDDSNFVVLSFDLFLGRRMVFSTYMLTLPCVFLACLTLVVFWLPPERPDRTALAMNSFASFMVLLLILVEAAMPTASSVPTLGLYYCFNMVIIMAAIVLSSVVVNVSKGRPGQKAPKCLLFITLNIMARCLCLNKMASEVRDLRKQQIKTRSRNRCCEKLQKLNRILCCGSREPEDEESCSEKLACNNADNIPRDTLATASLEMQMSEIRKTIQRIEMKMDSRRAKQFQEYITALEWRSIASVLDRFFFCLYVILIAISLAVFFPKPQSNNHSTAS